MDSIALMLFNQKEKVEDRMGDLWRNRSLYGEDEINKKLKQKKQNVTVYMNKNSLRVILFKIRIPGNYRSVGRSPRL
jgi:hypothetical protein